MEITHQQALSIFERRLRLLPGKQEYVRQLDECSVSQSSVFDRQRLAFDLYKAIHGKIYTQPELASLATFKDIIARHHFGVILKGISAYLDSPLERRAAFKKKVLSRPNIFFRIMNGIFYPQNTKV